MVFYPSSSLYPIKWECDLRPVLAKHITLKWFSYCSETKKRSSLEEDWLFDLPLLVKVSPARGRSLKWSSSIKTEKCHIAAELLRQFLICYYVEITTNIPWVIPRPSNIIHFCPKILSFPTLNQPMHSWKYLDQAFFTVFEPPTDRVSP